MKKFLFCLAAGLIGLAAKAQQPDTLTGETVVPQAVTEQTDGTLAKYRRSSLYTVLIRHPEVEYGESIESAFLAIPTPDKFNDHDLSIKSFDAADAPRQRKGKQRDKYNREIIDEFIEQNAVPRKMVAKWFDRDPCTGTFDMRLIQERGNYDASQLDIRLADQGALGRSALADAGEELIGKTFLLVNDITFVDKGKNSAKASGWLRALGTVAGAALGTDLSAVSNVTASLVNEIDGFSVDIVSYLYRLVWDDETAANFYNSYWQDASCRDAARTMGFDTTSLFRVAYVGKTSASAGNLASKSFSVSKKEQMLKICTRAIDKSIVQLQRDFDEFKVNVPLYRINEDGTVDVQIGLKEGINEKSQFDVLMPVLDENGRTSYEKIGRIQPIADKIWDNRFGAEQEAVKAADEARTLALGKAIRDNPGKVVEILEDAKYDEPLPGNVSLRATTFRVLNGKNKIVPGCLVREVTIKRGK